MTTQSFYDILLIEREVNEMKLEQAYHMVYDDMINSGCGLWVGKYDAKHGRKDFMFGIGTVMEYIAYQVSEKEGRRFLVKFANNMVESEGDEL